MRRARVWVPCAFLLYCALCIFPDWFRWRCLFESMFLTLPMTFMFMKVMLVMRARSACFCFTHFVNRQHGHSSGRLWTLAGATWPSAFAPYDLCEKLQRPQWFWPMLGAEWCTSTGRNSLDYMQANYDQLTNAAVVHQT